MYSRNRQNDLGQSLEGCLTLRRQIPRTEGGTIHYSCLLVVVKEASDPGVDFASEPVVLELVARQGKSIWHLNLVEDLGEVHD